MNLVSLALSLFLIKVINSQEPNPYTDTYTYTGASENFQFSTSKDQGSCMCDLTLNLCDYGCCCDELCTRELVNNWRGNGECIDPVDQRIEKYKCKNERDTYDYNKKKGGLTFKDQIDNLLCVRFDNSKEMGEFYDTKISLENIDTIFQDWIESIAPSSSTTISVSYQKSNAFGICTEGKTIDSYESIEASCIFYGDKLPLPDGINECAPITIGTEKIGCDSEVLMTIYMINNVPTKCISSCDTTNKISPTKGIILKTKINWVGEICSSNPSDCPINGDRGYIQGSKVRFDDVSRTFVDKYPIYFGENKVLGVIKKYVTFDDLESFKNPLVLFQTDVASNIKIYRLRSEVQETPLEVPFIFSNNYDIQELQAVPKTICLGILTGKFGPKRNPQNYIIGARIIIEYDFIDLINNDSVLVEYMLKVLFIPINYEDASQNSRRETSLIPINSTLFKLPENEQNTNSGTNN